MILRSGTRDTRALFSQTVLRWPGHGPRGLEAGNPGETDVRTRRQAASLSAAGAREWQDTGVTFGALVAAGAAEKGQRGSETSSRPEAAAAPASWGARFLIKRFTSWGSWYSSNPRQELEPCPLFRIPECGEC